LAQQRRLMKLRWRRKNTTPPPATQNITRRQGFRIQDWWTRSFINYSEQRREWLKTRYALCPPKHTIMFGRARRGLKSSSLRIIANGVTAATLGTARRTI